jgi:metal-responsive CopG/Arc/MetJ family transcriptional regulator
MAGKQKPKKKPSRSLRASVSFPENVYRELERLAKKKKVSVAWVVRDAAEKYVEDQWPLFRGTKEEK